MEAMWPRSVKYRSVDDHFLAKVSTKNSKICDEKIISDVDEHQKYKRFKGSKNAMEKSLKSLNFPNKFAGAIYSLVACI
jgi:hypothetical protein